MSARCCTMCRSCFSEQTFGLEHGEDESSRTSAGRDRVKHWRRPMGRALYHLCRSLACSCLCPLTGCSLIVQVTSSFDSNTPCKRRYTLVIAAR